jgi:hypothetical protein
MEKPAENRSIGDASDLLFRAMSLNELVYMAGESIDSRHIREAITTGSDVVDNMLREVKAILDANIARKDGAA